MFQVIYTSEATRPFSTDSLSILLASARGRNAACNVTGMLVFARGQFLQVLEGNATQVLNTFRRIETDSRHTAITVLYRGIAPQGRRSFDEWSMGFQVIEDLGELPQGVVRVNDRIDLTQFDHIGALAFLAACQKKPALS